MNKTLGQRYYENHYGYTFSYDNLSEQEKRNWERAANKLAKDFDAIRAANKVVKDEQTDDNPGVPVNDYS